MSKLRRRKLVVVSFHKGTRHPFVSNFEEVFLYGVLTKLSIHSDILVRDLATGLDRFNLKSELTLPQTLFLGMATTSHNTSATTTAHPRTAAS